MRRTVRTGWLASISLMAILAIAGNPTSSRAGDMLFLVATRDLPDPLFAQTVILMIPNMPPPLVVGLIVNKPTGRRLSDLMPASPLLKSRTEDAYFGGPVDIEAPAIVMRAGDPPSHATALFDGVYAVLDPEQAVTMLKSHAAVKDMRLYFGRSQWSREQLHSEMLRNSWYVVPADPASVFSSEPKTIWRALVERAELQKASFVLEPVPYPQ